MNCNCNKHCNTDKNFPFLEPTPPSLLKQLMPDELPFKKKGEKTAELSSCFSWGTGLILGLENCEQKSEMKKVARYHECQFSKILTPYSIKQILVLVIYNIHV